MKQTLPSAAGPIGIFDSGYGGLTILSKIREALPQYDYIYLGDNARAPYGTRSFEIVYEFTLQAVTKLFEMGCHLVILACNTASAKALRNIQMNDLPRLDPMRRVLGVIRPTVECIGNITQSRHVGVLATAGTIKSESYPLEVHKLFPDIKVSGEACPLWVSLVENNEAQGEGTDYFIRKNIGNLLAKDTQIDTVILGCTHFPLLLPKIQQYMPDGITTVVRPNGETYRVDPDGWTIPESVEQARRFAEGALASATTLEENAAELREEAYRLEAEARRCRRRNTQLTREWNR